MAWLSSGGIEMIPRPAGNLFHVAGPDDEKKVTSSQVSLDVFPCVFERRREPYLASKSVLFLSTALPESCKKVMCPATLYRLF